MNPSCVACHSIGQARSPWGQPRLVGNCAGDKGSRRVFVLQTQSLLFLYLFWLVRIIMSSLVPQEIDHVKMLNQWISSPKSV
jgi:hypothetical protein